MRLVSIKVNPSQTTNFQLFQIVREFADDNFKDDENDRKFSKRGRKKNWEKEKLLDTSNFSFSRSVFKRLVLQTRKNQGLFGKGLKLRTVYM